jgi:hypothetical protein
MLKLQIANCSKKFLLLLTFLMGAGLPGRLHAEILHSIDKLDYKDHNTSVLVTGGYRVDDLKYNISGDIDLPPFFPPVGV